MLQGSAQQTAPFLVEAAFDLQWAYLGQAVTYTVTAYSDTARDVTFDLPAFEGFWQTDTRAFAGSATLGGKQYNTAVYQIRLYPQRSGRLELDAARAEFAETVFNAGAIRLSNTASIEIMELPPEPENFSGLVGAVAAEFSAEPSVVTLGEPVAVTLILRGSANVAQFARPVLMTSGGWRLYSEPGNTASEMDGSLLMQARTLRWRAVPDRAGRSTLELPPIVYFSPADGYITLEIPSIELEVLPGPDGQLSRETQTQMVESLLVPALPQSTTGPVPPWAWLIAPLAAVGAIGGSVGLLRWRQLQAENRKKNALKRATARLRQAVNASDGLSRIGNAVHGYFEDSGGRIADTPEAGELLLAVEGERYHPQGEKHAAALAKRAAEILRRIEAGNERE